MLLIDKAELDRMLDIYDRVDRDDIVNIQANVIAQVERAVQVVMDSEPYERELIRLLLQRLVSDQWGHVVSLVEKSKELPNKP